MKITIAQGLLCVLVGASAAAATTMQSTTPRITPTGQVIKRTPSRLVNITSTDIITDIRTPPRVKQMIKRIEQKTERTIEDSHPGLAEPVDEDIELIEDSMKKLHFYKVERPTTDSGLSTWILLSGQTITSPSTTKSSKPPHKTENITRNASVVSNSNNVIRPLFKKRPPITNTKSSAPTTPKTTTSTSISTSTNYLEKVTKLAQISRPLKNNTDNKNASSTGSSFVKMNSTTDMKKNSIKLVKITTSTTSEMAVTTEIMPELKEGELELQTSTANPKKSRRPTNKKKKDKNRRKRPSLENKVDGQKKTKPTTKIAQKEKPISTQIYNYLAREVVPTVGVGLVGLVVTAGLASYFLYPFSGLRRSYEIDRKDKDLHYYDGSISSDYDGGIAEEEAIGKVIAGMPLPSNSYVANSHQKSYSHNRYAQVDSRLHPNPSIETIRLHPVQEYNKNENYIYDVQYSSEINKKKPYNKDIISQSVKASYNTDDQQFVVGNVPKNIVEEATPVAVPEHGPRNLKIRKRRNIDGNIINNEINVDESPQKFDQSESNEFEDNKSNAAKVNNNRRDTLKQSFFKFMDFFKNLLTTKFKTGLELLQNQTLAFSRYMNFVQ